MACRLCALVPTTRCTRRKRSSPPASPALAITIISFPAHNYRGRAGPRALVTTPQCTRTKLRSPPASRALATTLNRIPVLYGRFAGPFKHHLSSLAYISPWACRLRALFLTPQCTQTKLRSPPVSRPCANALIWIPIMLPTPWLVTPRNPTRLPWSIKANNKNIKQLRIKCNVSRWIHSK